jgi:hypothetical protein
MSALFGVSNYSVGPIPQPPLPPPSPLPFTVVTVNTRCGELEVARVEIIDPIPIHLSNNDKHRVQAVVLGPNRHLFKAIILAGVSL